MPYTVSEAISKRGHEMGRVSVAFQAFFAALGGRLTGDRLQLALADQSSVTDRFPVNAPPNISEGSANGRSEAVTLLSALQREARLVDLIQEPLGDYSDEQVGAAARDVLRDCRSVLERLFALRPVLDEVEESEVEASADLGPARLRVRGSSSSEGESVRGRLVHPGWEAGRCELPQWSGDTNDQLVVAPAEIEI